MSCCTKSANGVPGFSAFSAMVLRRSPSGGGPVSFSRRSCAGFSGGFSSAGRVICGSDGVISPRNSSRMSPSGVKIRRSVTFTSFGLVSLGVCMGTKLSRALEGLAEERVDARPGVVRGGLHVAAGVVGIHEGVARPFVNLDVRGLARFFQRGVEGPDVRRRVAHVVRAAIAADRRLARRGRRGEKAAAARRLGLEGNRLCEGG